MARLLLFSQVRLSLQLPFAVVPSSRLAGDRALTDVFVSSRTVKMPALIVAGAIITLNASLLGRLFFI